MVIKSTVPTGSNQIVKRTIQKVLDDRKVDLQFEVISNPDFGQKGSMIRDCLIPEMVVIGAESEAITLCDDPYEAVKGSDAIVIITSWREFKGLDQKRIKALMKDRYLFDLRNIFGEDPPKGFIYAGLGIPQMEV